MAPVTAPRIYEAQRLRRPGGHQPACADAHGLFQAHPRFTTIERVGGEARSKQIFELAKAYRGSHGEGNAEVSPEVRQQIRSILNRFLDGRVAASD